jgi:hypothetical protein
MNELPLFVNGHMYGWATLELRILGRLVIGITKIEYKMVSEKVHNYGKGRRPIGVGYGNIKPEAMIGLHQEELQALRAIAPFGDITQIPAFSGTVRGTRNNGTQSFVHRWIHVEFNEDGLTAAQGATDLSYEMPLFIGDIDFGGQLL